MRSYRPQELFGPDGRLIPELAELAPNGERRMSANPHANGGLLLRDLCLPDFCDYAIEVPKPGNIMNEDARTERPLVGNEAKSKSARGLAMNRAWPHQP
jgi:xylulose-5-phosphate/fructose-6-phosphate phosphoketolase